MIINKTNSVYRNAVKFISNGKGISKIRFNSFEMKEKFESLKKETDSYSKELVEFVECFATTAQYLSVLHDKTVNKLEKVISAAMIDSGYNEETRAHALNILKDIWLFGSELD